MHFIQRKTDIFVTVGNNFPGFASEYQLIIVLHIFQSMLCAIVDRKKFEIIKRHSFDICLYVYGWCLSLESTDTSYRAVWGSTGWVSRACGRRWTAGIPVWDHRGRCGGPAPKGGSSAPDRGVYLVTSVSPTNEHFRTNRELFGVMGP